MRVDDGRQAPWICPNCAHFMVSVDEQPTHICGAVDEVVLLLPYVDSAQASAIRAQLTRGGSR